MGYDISQKEANNTASYSYIKIYLKNRLKLSRTVNISQKAAKYISKRIDPAVYAIEVALVTCLALKRASKRLFPFIPV